MRIVVTGVRGPRTPWADEAVSVWGKRIQRYFPFEEVVIRAGGSEAEAEKLFAEVSPRGWLIAVDERGKELDSPGLAALVEDGARHGATELVFAVGGAFGHADVVRSRSRHVLRLSSFVLNHAVARVVLVEQIYRACTIRAGEPYHHA